MTIQKELIYKGNGYYKNYDMTDEKTLKKFHDSPLSIFNGKQYRKL